MKRALILDSKQSILTAQWHQWLAQCWMQCGTGLVKMFKRSMLLRHRNDPSNIILRHRSAYEVHNGKKPLTAQKRPYPGEPIR